MVETYPHYCAKYQEYHDAPCGCEYDLACVLCARALGIDAKYISEEDNG